MFELKNLLNKNFIWTRDPKEAYSNPYEYEAEEQFSRESYNLLVGLKEKLELFNRTFHRDDRSLEKATWMLLIDAIDSLLECHNFLLNKKHKVAGRLFRDAIEVIDLSSLFMSKTEKSKKLLEKWYNDEIIPNRDYRNYIENQKGKEDAEKYRKYYSQISKFNHRSYRTLAYGYLKNRNGNLVYDGFTTDLNNSHLRVFPGIISMQYVLLANCILILLTAIEKSKLISKTDIDDIWTKSIEKIPLQRKFKTLEEVYEERNK